MKNSVWLAVCAWAFLAWGTPGAIAADNEKVAAELRAIIDSGEPAIGNEDSDERIVEVYVFYAADRNFKPLWVRDSGPKAKSREVLAVFKAAGEMGLNPGNYRVVEIEKRLNASTPRELAELELLLSRAFIDFGRDVSRGRILPSSASSENAIVAREIGPLTLIDGAETSDSIAEFVKTIEPDTPEYRRLFDVAVDVHDRVIAELRPGMTGRDVDRWLEPFRSAGCRNATALIGGWSTYNHAPNVGLVDPPGPTSPPTTPDFRFEVGQCLTIIAFPVIRDTQKGLWVGTTCVVTDDGLEKLHDFPVTQLRVVPV